MQRALDVIGILSNVIEVGSFLVVVALFWQAQRQLRRYLRTREHELSERPWAIAMGIGGDITGQVKPYLQKQGLADVPIKTYVREGLLPAGKFPEVLRDMLVLKARLSQLGATEIHLFYRGPVTLAMGIGSVFDNWVPVKVYEYTEGTYRLDFVLEKGSVLGLIGTDPLSRLRELAAH